MSRFYGLLGVPSSTGAMTPGIEKAPQALREAGIVEQLRQAGFRVNDHGDLPRTPYLPDRASPTAQNLERVVRVATDVAQQVSAMVDAGETPLVIGGDCTITIGVMAGYVQHDPDISLLYMDGGLDLFTPPTKMENKGHMDSMGVAHMLGEPGAAESLSHIGARFPLLSPEQVTYYGFEHGASDDPEEVALRKYAMRNFPAKSVRGRAKAAAVDALASIEARPFVLHFDVDVIDFLDFPISDVPLIDEGLPFADAMDSLRVFAASPQFAGLVITEINPDHTVGDGIQTFVRELVSALTT
jgi:arginase